MIISKEILKHFSSNGYVLQFAVQEEIEDILQLYIERTAWFRQKGINQWQKYLEHHNKDEFLMAISKKQLFVIRKDNIIVACFEISDEPRLWKEEINDSFYIYKIVTKVGETGLGKLIFDICEKIAKENNKTYLKIDCLERNKKLNEIYASYGFDLVKTDTQDYYTFNLRRKTV